jgi:TRAP-type C4-dicarboxylate transport system permease small subunit
MPTPRRTICRGRQVPALLYRLDHWLAGLESAALVVLLSSLLGLGLLQIVLRNVWASGLFWAEELLQHLVLWLGFLGASLATRAQSHLRIDVVSHLLPARLHPWVALGTNLAALMVCGLLAHAAWTLVRVEHAAGTTLTFGVAAWVAQSIMPVGLGIMALRFALHTYEALRRLTRREG